MSDRAKMRAALALLSVATCCAALPAPAQAQACRTRTSGACGAVDPATYAAPPTPRNAASCGAVPSCGTSSQQCPHCSGNLKPWNAASTWPAGAGVPPAGPAHDVTLPVGARVLLSGCMLAAGAQFRRIVIPETSEVTLSARPTLVGTFPLHAIHPLSHQQPARTLPHPCTQLVFDDAPINLTVAGIQVSGKLTLGSPTCRLSSQIAITFANDPDSSGVGLPDTALRVRRLQPPAPSFSFTRAGCATPSCAPPNRDELLQARPGAKADVHGALFTPTWTRLAGTALPNATSVTLQVRLFSVTLTPSLSVCRADRLHANPGSTGCPTECVAAQVPVNWRAGQLVALTTSIWKDECRNQVRTRACRPPERVCLRWTLHAHTATHRAAAE